MQCARPCTPIPPLHACSMLTRWTLCCRSLLGRIWESKNIPHIVVGSASRSCGHCWGRGRARKALARGCGRCVLLPCSARRCPARKSPTHALCRRACVNGRGPLGGFHNYILIREYPQFTTQVPLLLLPRVNTLLTSRKSVNNLSPRLTFTTQS